MKGDSGPKMEKKYFWKIQKEGLLSRPHFDEVPRILEIKQLFLLNK